MIVPHPDPAGRERPAAQHDHLTRRPASVFPVLGCCLLASVLAACSQQPRTTVAPSPSPVTGWQTITPPWQSAVTGSSFGQYVVSRDIPGLIVACFGQSSGPPYHELSGTARLWRSRDGGAHWQVLAATIPLGSCGALTMITGSSGLLVTPGSDFAGSGSGTLLVSPDAGDTWKTVSRYLPHEIAANRFTAMQQAVYRDGRLYASLIFNDVITRLFSVSDDDGVTWTTLEQVPTPAPDEIPVVTEHFAPDYRAPHAWFRYALHGPFNFGLPHYTTLDHSTDDGRTWTTLTRLDAGTADLPQYGRPLVTSPQQPSRLCVGLNVSVYLPGDRFPVSDAVLGASDDAGTTWHYTRISHIQEDGRIGDPYPLMDAEGNCYTSVVALGGGSAGGQSVSTESTFLRLAPGGGAQPEVVAAR
ncbi:MAG TPA: sialidase family protein, partial [Ktedonobacterales bacterium]|nr:sialidase family protein [Ktedonobacterales bacterium]